MSLADAQSELRQALAEVRTGGHETAAPRVARAMRLLQAHRLRHGRSNHPDALLDLSPDLDDEQQLEQLLLLRAATLAAEIGDYQGDRAAVAKALRPFRRLPLWIDEQREDACKALEFDSDEMPGWQLLRQRLFCAIQFVVAAYRIERGPEARRIIDAALAVAEAMSPGSDGLLAQLYYTKAKLMQGERKFLEATVLFRRSLAKAAARSGRVGERAIERRAAQYGVGKAMALGLAQSLLDEGRTEEAHSVAVAGQMLLALTEDLVHRHYAQQMLGSIQRASARDSDAALLDEAANNLEAARLFFEQTKKPAAALRSRYELALIALHRGDTAAARGALRALLADAKRARLEKWVVSAHIGLSRAARRDADYLAAAAEAEAALTLAAQAHLTTLAIKARTALAQVRVEQHMKSPERLREVEREVRDLLVDVPEHDARSRVVALLVLVRVLGARGEFPAARAEYGEYERIAHLVQSRRIADLAAVALREISPLATGFRCPADDTPPVFDLRTNREVLEKYVAAKASEKGGTEDEIARRLGMSPSTFHKHGLGKRRRGKRTTI